MARNKNLELDNVGSGRWLTADGRFGVFRRVKAINPMEATFNFKIKKEYSIHSFVDYDGPKEWIQLAPEIGRVDTFGQVYPFLGEYTEEGSFEKGEPAVAQAKPLGGARKDSKLSEDVLVEEALTKKWLDGVKKWWKQWVRKADKVRKLGKKEDYKKVMAYFEEGETRLKRIKDNLDYKKGFAISPWQVASDTGDEGKDRVANIKGAGIDPRVEIVYLFEDALNKIYLYQSTIETSWEALYDPTSMAYKSYPDQIKQKTFGPNKDMDAFQSYVFNVPFYVKKIDSIVSGKLFRKLNKEVNKYEKMGQDPINLGDGESEFSVGNVKVVIDSGRRDLQAMSYANLWKAADEAYLKPGVSKRYVKAISSAMALLKKAGFGKVWHGVVAVKPAGKSGDFTLKSGRRTRAAGTWSYKDKITLYGGPKDRMIKTLVHEMGHRWYYKFMNRADRARFSDYFEKVKPVTAYGGEDAVEDFAEVFAWYVMGKKLTRDQRERFKQFALKGGRIRRHESIRKMYDELICN